MSCPWLSVVVPTYNGARYLATALESIAEQADDTVELIAVDDGSDDDTLAILDRYQKQMPATVLRREHIGNWVANTNLGLRTAKGQYACILHQDDFWLPGRLARIRELLASHPETLLLLHPSWYVDARGKRLGKWRCPLPRHGRPLAPEFIAERLLVQNFISMPAPVFNRHKALELGGMEESWRYTADWDLWMKISAAGPTVYWPEAFSCFRVHAEAQTVQCSARFDGFRRELRETLDRHLGIWRKRSPRVVTRSAAAARFSVDVNATLAAMLRGSKRSGPRLLLQLAGLGPGNSWRYVRDSRILERIAARLRTQMQPAQSPISGSGCQT